MSRSTRLVAFWSAILVASVIANFGVEVVADQFPDSGFAKLVAYTHKGTN